MAGVKPVKKAAGATAKVAYMDLAAFNSLQSAAAELKKHMNCKNPCIIRLTEEKDLLCRRPHCNTDPHWLARAKARSLSDEDLAKAMAAAKRRRRGF